MSRRRCDVFYVECWGDVVGSYQSWTQRSSHLSETSATWSGQVFEFCRRENLRLYAVSSCPTAATLTDQNSTIVNLPRQPINIPKIGYDLSTAIYGLRLLIRAFRLRPKIVLLDIGTAGFVILSLFRLTGAQIVAVAHSALWPDGFPHSGLIAKLRRKAQRLFWRHCATSSIVVSPAIRRQIQAVSGVSAESVYVMRPSFPTDAFATAPAVKQFSSDPFRVMLPCRIEENKGVFDLLSVAELLRSSSKRPFEFAICGDGSYLDLLKEQIQARGLQQIVKTYGQLNRPELVAQYLNAHLVIVPTRSTFAEGFAKVVAESILLLRPVLSNTVVPACEVFGDAVILAETDNVRSYAVQIDAVSTDEIRYQKLVDECKRLRSFILDDSESFLAALNNLKKHSANNW
jgi:glycogen(starch) synthase